jgi:hypothetical protein
MFFNLVFVCTSASIRCLAMFCAVIAREHNKPADANEDSSNACATCTGTFTSLAEDLEFVSHLLNRSMMGFTIVTGVSLSIFQSPAEGICFTV